MTKFVARLSKIESFAVPAIILLSYLAFCFDMLRVRFAVSVILYAVSAAIPLWLLTRLVRYIIGKRTATYDGLNLSRQGRPLNNPRTLKWICVMLCVLSIGLAMFVSLIQHKGSFSFNYLRKGVFWALAALSVALFGEYRGTNLIRYALGLGCLAVVGTAGLVFVFKIGTIYYGNGGSRYLVLNLSNPNYLGIIMAYTFLIALYLFASDGRLWVKILMLAVAAAAIVFILGAGSRGPLIAIAIGFVIFVFGVVRNWAKPMGSIPLITVLLLLPLFVACVYVLAVQAIENVDSGVGTIQTSLVSGKSFATRYEMWVDALRGFVSNPIIGNYFEITEGLGNLQMHNVWLDLLASCGLLTFLFFFLICVISIYESTRFSHKNIMMYMACFSAFFGCFLIGIFEAGIMVSTIRFVAFLPLLSVCHLDRWPRSSVIGDTLSLDRYRI